MLGNRKGFTLIELLIVVVIIGILAAIAIPKFSSAREKAYFSAMMTDLKNLATQQEIYYSQYYRYSPSNDDVGFVPSDGVNVSPVEASQMGWAAIATHDALGSDLGCAIYLGKAAAPTTHGSPTQAGAVACQMTKP